MIGCPGVAAFVFQPNAISAAFAQTKENSEWREGGREGGREKGNEEEEREGTKAKIISEGGRGVSSTFRNSCRPKRSGP